MVMFDERHDKMQVDKRVNLGMVKEFTIRVPQYRIVHKYVNKQNLCYAVLLNASNSEKPNYIYMPVDYSVHIADNIPIHFDPFDRQKITLEYKYLKSFIEEFNKFIEDNYSVGHLTTYRKVEIQDYVAIPLQSLDAQSSKLHIIGFNTPDNMVYYFNKFDEDEIDATKTVKNIRYDYNEINRLIINRADPTPDNRTKLIGESLYNNYIYQLFVIEFINYLDRERNKEMRSAIKKLIEETNFKKDVHIFRREMMRLLGEYPSDMSIFNDNFIVFYYVHYNKARLISDIDSTVFEFDRVTMNKLKKLPRDEMKAELKEIAKTFSVQKDFDTSNIDFPNIYLPCGDIQDETGYCEKSKLMVNRDIDDLIDILATDIMDDLKAKYLMTALFGDNILNVLKFTQHPTEIVTIYRRPEREF
jgi:hypothetical protein